MKVSAKKNAEETNTHFLGEKLSPNRQVREKACNKIANLLASRNLMDTPLDKVSRPSGPPKREEGKFPPDTIQTFLQGKAPENRPKPQRRKLM